MMGHLPLRKGLVTIENKTKSSLLFFSVDWVQLILTGLHNSVIWTGINPERCCFVHALSAGWVCDVSGYVQVYSDKV